MHLSFSKCVPIPLWNAYYPRVEAMLRLSDPDAALCSLSYAARYLGYMVGPRAAEVQWDFACIAFDLKCAAIKLKVRLTLLWPNCSTPRLSLHCSPRITI